MLLQTISLYLLANAVYTCLASLLSLKAIAIDYKRHAVADQQNQAHDKVTEG